MPFPAVPTRVQCPKCGASFIVNVRTIIDVGQEPELKEQFLRGEVNYARCPQCGGAGILSTPLIYHDPSKELLLCYVPMELGLSAEEQERTVGSLLNALMNSVPAEQRKGYFFQPKTVLTYNSLLEAILEAEGISKEQLEQQRQWLAMVDDLLQAMDDQEAFQAAIEKHRDALTYEFFLMLSDLIEVEAQRLPEGAENPLETLRSKLLEHVTPAMPQGATAPNSPEALIEHLLSLGSDEALESAALQHLADLDYNFFQTLTQRLEAAENSGNTEMANKLARLRERLLAVLDRQTQRLREAEDEANLLIMDILEAEDLEAAVREHADKMDDLFFLVLARLRQTAINRGHTRRAERLEQLLETARRVHEERLPADLRLISRLLRAQYPDESNQLLEESRGLLNRQLLETFDRYIAQVESFLDDEARERLRHIRQQMEAKLTIQRA